MCDGGLPPRAELIVYRPALTFVDDPIMELLQSPLNLVCRVSSQYLSHSDVLALERSHLLPEWSIHRLE